MRSPALVAGSGADENRTSPYGGDRLFIFGLGYSALEIAKVAQAAGFSVAGTTRSAEKMTELSALGIEAFSFDNFPSLDSYSHILYSIPPQVDGSDWTPRQTRGLGWLGYLSTTGVYGDWGGAWVDEASETRPNNARLQRRVAAEAAWRECGAHIFRLAGIYGPGRSAIEDVLEGSARRIDKPGQVFSRIHVEDIAQVVVASMKHPNPTRVYNVCDDAPAPQREVVEFTCELLKKPLPPLLAIEEANLSPMGLEFYSANRRVHNELIKRELAISLKYPSYREGLSAIARQKKLV